MAPPPATFDWKAFKKGTEEKMSKSLENIQTQMNTLRAGGASPGMLDRVFVDQYGTPTPLGQVARVATSGAQQLVIEPFDKSLVKEIEKAISTSDLNLTPTNDGSGVIRINVPPLTEERRKELCKQAKTISEDGKVAVRNVRRDSVDKIKAAEKDKTISKDDSKGTCHLTTTPPPCVYVCTSQVPDGNLTLLCVSCVWGAFAGFQDDLQKSTDAYIKKLDDMLKKKETDLMKI